MTADEAKAALRCRHPAEQRMGSRVIQGCWTTVEEWLGVDLIAFSSHATPSSGGVPGVRYPRVGYEVKVSRADYRRELMKPHKRVQGVEWCNAFYFAVPKGLLTAAELAYVPPAWEPGDFARVPCRYAVGPERPSWNEDPGPCYRGTRSALLVGPLKQRHRRRPHVDVKCDGCDGRGYEQKSRVELEAPTLWIPPDVGLIEIDGRGCHITRRSPTRQTVAAVDAGQHLNTLIRWISVRPDPRHPPLRQGG